MGMNQIGIGVAAAKISFGNTIDDRASGSTELVFKNFNSIRASNGMHGIKTEAKAFAEQGFYRVKIKYISH